MPVDASLAGGDCAADNALNPAPSAKAINESRQFARDGGIPAGNRDHGEAGVVDRAHEPCAGIADGRRPGIADERNAPARTQQVDDLDGALRLVVLVQRPRPGRDSVVPQQNRRYARVLRRDDIGAAEHVERPQRDVAQITERRGDHI